MKNKKASAYQIPVEVRLAFAQDWARMVKIDPFTGCAIWIGDLDKDQYGRYSHTDENGVRIRYQANRVAHEVFEGPIGDGNLACHLCDRKSCVWGPHIEPGTQKENMKHHFDKVKGLRTPLTTPLLTEEQLKCLRDAGLDPHYIPENQWETPEKVALKAEIDAANDTYRKKNISTRKRGKIKLNHNTGVKK